MKVFGILCLLVTITFGAPITDPNDPRSFQGATVGTFAQLIYGSNSPANRQKIVDAELLDDAVFPVPEDSGATLVENSWSLSPSAGGCKGRSLSMTTWAYTCSTGLNVFQAANTIDDTWFQSSGTIGQTVFELPAPTCLAAVFVSIDHAPLPGESIESTIYVSETATGPWEQANLFKVYLEGHLQPHIWDGFVYLVNASVENFKYVSTTHGGPGALRVDGDDEINGVVGLNCDESVVTSTGLPTLNPNIPPVCWEKLCNQGIDLDGNDENDHYFGDFNGISFNDWTVSTGDIEGRLLVRGNFVGGPGYTVGTEKNNTNDAFDIDRTYALVVGGNVDFKDGAVAPGDERIFVGGVFTTESNFSFAGQVDQGNAANIPFDIGYDCFKTRSQTLYDLTANVNLFTNIYPGLFYVSCQDPAATYYIFTLTAAEISTGEGTSWILDGCNPNARWVVNIDGGDGSTPILLAGGSLGEQAKNGYVTYNIHYDTDFEIGVCASGLVTVRDTLLNGHLIAPSSSVYQRGALIAGDAIVCNYDAVGDASQVNKGCQDYDVLVTAAVEEATVSYIRLLSSGAFQEGDQILDSEGNVIGSITDVDGNVITYDPSAKKRAVPSKGDVIQTSFSSDAIRPIPEASIAQNQEGDDNDSESSASQIIFSTLLLSVLAFFF